MSTLKDIQEPKGNNANRVLDGVIAMKNQYRIVKDSFAGYEAQKLYWWFPFVWWQIGGINTFSSVEKAEDYIKNRGVVKYVD